MRFLLTSRELRGLLLQPRSIATLTVSGDGPEMDLPGSVSAWDPPSLPITRQRSLAHTVSRAADNAFLSSRVAAEFFDPDRPAYQIPVHMAEEWTLINDHDSKLVEHARVFDIHQNPFKVTNTNGAQLATPLSGDTFVLTHSSADSFTFESNFLYYTGKFVQHRHVLHEDLEMMSASEVTA